MLSQNFCYCAVSTFVRGWSLAAILPFCPNFQSLLGPRGQNGHLLFPLARSSKLTNPTPNPGPWSYPVHKEHQFALVLVFLYCGDFSHVMLALLPFPFFALLRYHPNKTYWMLSLWSRSGTFFHSSVNCSRTKCPRNGLLKQCHRSIFQGIFLRKLCRPTLKKDQEILVYMCCESVTWWADITFHKSGFELIEMEYSAGQGFLSPSAHSILWSFWASVEHVTK